MDIAAKIVILIIFDTYFLEYHILHQNMTRYIEIMLKIHLFLRVHSTL